MNASDEHRATGKKGGTSSTAGRKAEIISVEIEGVVFSKRVFAGQRFLLVYFSTGKPPLVTAWPDEASARKNATGCERDGYRSVIAAATVG
jgi:hypothetical protein